MSNSFFRFKEFAIHQDVCAMKVCTDSCLFGAWVAAWLAKHKPDTKNILDVGAGTGLLSLILAQKLSHAIIEGIEIDPVCFQQANLNVLQSPWNNRIQLFNTDAKSFDPEKRYEFLITNPPFYESDMASKNLQKNIAHHSTSLTLNQLIDTVKRLVDKQGSFAVMLPYHRTAEFEKSVTGENFFVHQKTLVRQSIRHSFFRSMFIVTREKKGLFENEIAIKDNAKNYTLEFASLLKDYYLHL